MRKEQNACLEITWVDGSVRVFSQSSAHAVMLIMCISGLIAGEDIVPLLERARTLPEEADVAPEFEGNCDFSSLATIEMLLSEQKRRSIH